RPSPRHGTPHGGGSCRPSYSRGMDSQFVRLDQVRALDLGPGFTAFPLFGENVMLNLVELAPNSVVPMHSHPHEQLGLVLRGDAVMNGGGTRPLMGATG